MRHLLPALMCGLVFASAAAQDLDEVEVLGRKLWQMREDILVAEERFYSLTTSSTPTMTSTSDANAWRAPAH